MRRYDCRRAIQFLAFIAELPALTIQPFDDAGIAASANLVKKFSDQKLTLADAHGLALIEKRKIAACWSTDWHFTLSGASLVI